MRLTIDFETRSACDIKKRGGWVYSEDPTTEILCLALKWEKRPPVLWDMDNDSTAWLGVFDAATTIEAHNMSFEYAIWTNIGMKRHGWPPLPIEKLRCSAAKASMHSLPRDLERACLALNLPIKKDMDGYRLMMRLCRPRKPKKGEPEYNFDDPNGLYWYNDPEDLERLGEYCKNDTFAEEALSDALRDLPDQELRIWQLDQIVNSRGIQADLEGAAAMIAMVKEHEGLLLERLRILTGGTVKTAKQLEAMRNFLRGLGVDLPDLTAATVKEALKQEISQDAREILEIRKSLGRSSAAKYKAIADRASFDGRVRGTLIYHGTSTGRWCLARGSLILVKDAFDIVLEKPIEQVTIFDRVWDGKEWVEHQGVVYSGDKDVIEYNKILATPSHKVYISDTEYITLGEACRKGIPLYESPPLEKEIA